MKRWNRSRFIRLAVSAILLGAVLTSLFPIAFWAVLYGMYHPLPPRVREDRIQVACIGDSITYGAGVRGRRFYCSYPAVLQRDLGWEYHVQNYGLSGRTLLSGGDDPYVEEEFCRLSHERPADIYLIMLGSNDSKSWNWDGEAYAREMREFVRSYQELEGGPRVYLLTPPCAFHVAGDPAIPYAINPSVIEAEILPILSEIAEETDVTLIDIYHLTQDHPEWMMDGVHPNARGNREIAREVAGYLRQEE